MEQVINILENLVSKHTLSILALFFLAIPVLTKVILGSRKVMVVYYNMHKIELALLASFVPAFVVSSFATHSFEENNGKYSKVSFTYKIKKYKIVIGSVCLIILLIFGIAQLVFSLPLTEEICGLQVILGADMELLDDGKTQMALEKEMLTYYDSVEDSLYAEMWGGEPPTDSWWDRKPPEDTPWGEEIVRFQNDEYMLVLLDGELKGNKVVGLDSLPCLDHALFNASKEKVSYPIYHWQTGIKTAVTNTRKIYHEEDLAVKDIANSYGKEEVTRLVNDGIPIYYGVGIEPKTNQLTILGESPTEVIPFKYQDETYYLWYYLDAERFGTVYEENIDPSVTTMAEMIEIFDIRFDGMIP